ncbi:MAG TPA: ATP-binding protein [Ktedonobacteraceae bacterium]|nr:ATP-binding protein [Ktedonobacteraceae bacterium]
MRMRQLNPFRLWKKRRLPLRIRLALGSATLVFVLSFALLLFINTTALERFPNIIRYHILTPTRTQQSGPLPAGSFTRPAAGDIYRRAANPLEFALLLELRNISLIGLAAITVLGGIGAYWLAGMALRPVRKVSAAARRIEANTLNTRLALDGPSDEVKELADTFDAMLARLQSTFELQKRFVADVAHELRTPLASLRTNLEVVAGDPQANLEDFRAMIATQERALTRLECLVADLLILATAEQQSTGELITLASLLEEVVCDLEYIASMRQIELQLESDGEGVVRGNGPLLARAFSNLIENAIYYNRPGGKVTISFNRKDRWAVVVVADTGIGIPFDKQSRIFDRFYRADSSRSRHKGGAGLGLSIVSAIVQHHGGRIQVESTPDVGSTFTILLPLAQNLITSTSS